MGSKEAVRVRRVVVSTTKSGDLFLESMEAVVMLWNMELRVARRLI